MTLIPVVCACSWSGHLLITRGDCPSCGRPPTARMRQHHIEILESLSDGLSAGELGRRVINPFNAITFPARSVEPTKIRVEPNERIWLKRHGLITPTSPRTTPSDNPRRRAPTRQFAVTEQGHRVLDAWRRVNPSTKDVA